MQADGRGFWDDISNHRMFMDDIAKRLKISNPQDWTFLTARVLKQNGGAVLLRKYDNSPSKLLNTVYPEYLAHCRNTISQLVSNFSLSKVEDLLTVSYKYLEHKIIIFLLLQPNIFEHSPVNATA